MNPSFKMGIALYTNIDSPVFRAYKFAPTNFKKQELE